MADPIQLGVVHSVLWSNVLFMWPTINLANNIVTISVSVTAGVFVIVLAFILVALVFFIKSRRNNYAEDLVM